MSGKESNGECYYRLAHVGRMLGVSSQSVRHMYDRGALSGHRLPGSGDRRISRSSLVTYAKKHKIVIKSIGMFPYRIVTLGVGWNDNEMMELAAVASEATVVRADTQTDFGIIVADRESMCCGVVDTSIGMVAARDVCLSVRRHDVTKKMALIALAGEDRVPSELLDCGFTLVMRRPFDPKILVKHIVKHATEYSQSDK